MSTLRRVSMWKTLLASAGIRVTRAAQTMVPRKARLRKKDEARKRRHWAWRKGEGGPYRGNGGNSAMVWEDAVVCSKVFSPAASCGISASCLLGASVTLCSLLP